MALSAGQPHGDAELDSTTHMVCTALPNHADELHNIQGRQPGLHEQQHKLAPCVCVDKWVFSVASSSRLSPKSHSLQMKPRVSSDADFSSTFAGFRSPCRMPAPCR